MKNYGMWVGICILLFAGFIFWGSLSLPYYGQYGPGPGLFPRWLSILLALFAIIYIIDCLMKDNKITFADVMPKGKVLFRVLSVAGSIFLFILIAPFVGYIIAGILVTMILLLPDFKWYSSLAISATVTLALFLVFKTLLDIPLPANIWGF